MKKMKYTTSIIFIFFVFITNIISQESLEPIIYNEFLRNNETPTHKKSASNERLTIPFFDDFSYASKQNVYPDPKRWLDKNVYVNTSYCINPPSIGIATFDILDEKGKIYEKAIGNLSFTADTLTSLIINLSEFSLKDSVYLSFYYQCGGNGEMPETSDSLIVQFYSSKIKSWQNVWSVSGNNSSTNVFTPVLIKLNSSQWFDSLFQFRFLNKASLNTSNTPPGMKTNCDIWNIDYVYLNKNRTYFDTSYNDIAIVSPISSFIKNYKSMPWKHYKVAFSQVAVGRFNLPIVNHNKTSAEITCQMEINDILDQISFEPVITTIDIGSHEYSSFEDDFPTLSSDQSDSASFLIKAYLKTNNLDRKCNDTLVMYQFFKNYYSYDDGSAEYGYGLRGDNIIGTMVAYKFESYIADTLTAIDIYFNRSYNDENVTYFNLIVWNENNGLPGDSLGGQKSCKPAFNDNFPSFQRFYLDTPIVVSKNFYIGWEQTDEVFLNIGYDRNTNASNKIYYNLEKVPSGWTQSNLNKKGALMIRPVFGTKKKSLIYYTSNDYFTVYPNPSNDYIFIKFQNNKIYTNATLKIYDLTGKLISTTKFTNDKIDISYLNKGVYFIKIVGPYILSNNIKFVKQ